MLPVPSRLEATLDRRIWGMRDLAPLFPDLTNQDPPLAEMWFSGPGCRLASGPLAGHELKEAWREMPVEWKGTRCAADPEIPVLVKYIFAADKLSIQVHPGDEYAAQHEAARGGRGKTEMWHALFAQPGAELMLNLRPGVTPAAFRAALEDGTLENLLVRVPVATGDTLFVPAGTVHTICSGVMLCEIQEQSDITYRVYDYKRKGRDGKERPLHVRQALEVINFGEQTGEKVAPVVRTQHGLTIKYLAACRYFATDRWEFTGRIGAVTSPGSFTLLAFLSGAGRLEWGGQGEPYARNQVWFLPASLGAYQIEAAEPTVVLHISVPDLEAYCRRLESLRIPRAEWSRIVHP
jgi:mannose-6-phosphate isomerase